ncbi:hypothetical protein GCM10010182_79290 [Actinomadura cremea]|nr:hypothetical protein GCM10010182_79290 [Actinomadura cremea]
MLHHRRQADALLVSGIEPPWTCCNMAMSADVASPRYPDTTNPGYTKRPGHGTGLYL